MLKQIPMTALFLASSFAFAGVVEPSNRGVDLSCIIDGHPSDPQAAHASIVWSIDSSGEFRHHWFQVKGIGKGAQGVQWVPYMPSGEWVNQGEGIGEIRGREITYTFVKYQDRDVFPDLADVYRLTLPYPLPRSKDRHDLIAGSFESSVANGGRTSPASVETYPMLCDVTTEGETNRTWWEELWGL